MIVKQENNNKNGIGFIGLLQIAFIVLKWCGIINWSWWIVFLPIIGSVALFIVLVGVCVWLEKRS